MKVIGLLTLNKFLENHSECKQQLHSWLAEAKDVIWATPNDIKSRYVSASFLADNRVVFNIKGNGYRLDTKIYYQRQVVMIMRMGTHAEYMGWKF
jgi:mRNA interferase HigB